MFDPDWPHAYCTYCGYMYQPADQRSLDITTIQKAVRRRLWSFRHAKICKSARTQYALSLQASTNLARYGVYCLSDAVRAAATSRDHVQDVTPAIKLSRSIPCGDLPPEGPRQ